MTSHELARTLLELPDLPVVSGIERSGYGEGVDFVNEVTVKVFDSDTDTYGGAVNVIDLVLSESSEYES